MAGDLIACGAPVDVLAAWLDRGLTPDADLFKRAAHAQRADVLALLFSSVTSQGPAAIEAAAIAALTPPSAMDASVFDNLESAWTVLCQTTPDLLNPGHARPCTAVPPCRSGGTRSATPTTRKT
ncbi:MAG: hypothetical protein VB137_04115 [Burkholderia sp.]